MNIFLYVSVANFIICATHTHIMYVTLEIILVNEMKKAHCAFQFMIYCSYFVYSFVITFFFS